MTRISKILIAAATSMTALSGTAFADDAAEGESAASEAAAAPETALTAASGGAGFNSSSWSTSIADRPLNLLAGMIRVQGDGLVLKVNVPAVPPATMSSSSTGAALIAGFGYGISNKLEVGGSYGISVKEFEAKGPLTAYGLFSIKNEEKLRISAGAALTVNLAADNALGLTGGLAAQYHLNNKMFVYMPPTHLAIGLNPDTSLALNIPVGFGFQATPNIFASAETSLASIGISPSGSAFIFADRTPLTVSAFYSPSNKMDLGVSIGASDIPHIADLFVIGLTARLFFGKVPSSGTAAMSTITPPPAPTM